MLTADDIDYCRQIHLSAESVVPATSACAVAISLNTIAISLCRKTSAVVWQSNHIRAKTDVIADFVIYLYIYVVNAQIPKLTLFAQRAQINSYFY
jgi:hypothetical protein